MMDSQSASGLHTKNARYASAVSAKLSGPTGDGGTKPVISTTPDNTLLDDIKGQLKYGDAASGAQVNPATPLPEITEKHLDTLLRAGTAPEPQGSVLPGESQKPEREPPTEVLESTSARPTGTTVSIGDRPLAMKKEAKKGDSEVPKASSGQKAKDLPLKPSQTDRASVSDGKTTLSFSDVDDFVTAVSQKKLEESGSVARKAQQASSLPLAPAKEQLITTTEMSLTHKDPIGVVEGQPQPSVPTRRSDVANRPLSEEVWSTTVDLRGGMGPMVPTKTVMEVGKGLAGQSVNPIVPQRKVGELAMQVGIGLSAETKLTKTPPTSLDLGVDKKSSLLHDSSMPLPKPAADQKGGSDDQLQRSFHPARPNGKDSSETNKWMSDQSSRTFERRSEPGANASSHLSHSSINASSQASETNESQLKDARQPTRTESHVQGKSKEMPPAKSSWSNRAEPNALMRYSPTKATSDHRQTTPLPFGTVSPRKSSKARYTKGAQETANLDSSDGSQSSASMKPTEGDPKNSVVDDGTEKRVSRPRIPRPSSASQRATERSLSPVKRERPRPRPASAAPATESNKMRGTLARPAEARVTTTFRHSYNVTHTRVSQRPGTETGSTNSPQASASERPRPQSRRAKVDIFEERASSRGWVSCINPSNSILNQKIHAAQMKSTLSSRDQSLRSNRSYRGTEKCRGTRSDSVPYH